jgi:EpsI family protein
VVKKLLLVGAIFLGAYSYLLYAEKPRIIPVRETLQDVPSQFPEWRGIATPPIDPKVLAVSGVDDYLSRTYISSDQSEVSLYIGYYQSQRAGDTIHSPLNCLPGAGWNPLGRKVISVSIQPKAIIRINSIVVIKGTDKQEVLYWYHSHGRVIATEYWAKYYTILDAFRTNRTDGALVRVITPIAGLSSDEERKAEDRGVAFIKTIFPVLGRFLPN